MIGVSRRKKRKAIYEKGTQGFPELKDVFPNSKSPPSAYHNG